VREELCDGQVVEAGQRITLDGEAPCELAIEGMADALDRHATVGRGVVRGEIHLTHSAATEEPDDAVAGDIAGGAQRFVDTIALGPGAWSQLPQAIRDTFTFNAPTWLDEFDEPGSLALDLDQLSGFAAPTLLTLGGQSPPFFPLVVERIAQALPAARRHVFAQAGHVPHLSHPQEYIAVVGSSIREAAARPGASAA
jgi:pimeloyl-ACP methyl ester carboxylesterase